MCGTDGIHRGDTKELREDALPGRHLLRSALLFSMNMSEQMDVFERRKKWTKILQDKKQQSLAVLSWANAPPDYKKLQAAFVEAKASEGQELTQVCKKSATDSTSEGGCGAKSSTGGRNSESFENRSSGSGAGSGNGSESSSGGRAAADQEEQEGVEVAPGEREIGASQEQVVEKPA